MQIILVPIPGASNTLVTLDGDTLCVNGEAHDLSGEAADDEMTIPYGLDGALSTMIGDTAHNLHIEPRPDDPAKPYVEPDPPQVPTEAESLAALRPDMVAYRWQLMAVMGADLWGRVQALGADETLPWVARAAIINAQVIPRVSETVDTIAYFLGLTDEDTDKLFAAAAALVA